MQQHYEDKLNYLIKMKEYSDTQIEDWKDKNEKQEYLYEELSRKNKGLNDDLLRKHEELLKVKQEIKKNEETIGEYQQLVERNKAQMEAHEKK